MTGKYYEDLTVGEHIRHTLGRTITEMDNILFCALTMNSQPLHLNEDFARTDGFPAAHCQWHFHHGVGGGPDGQRAD